MDIDTKDVQWPGVMWDDDEPRAEGLHLGSIIKALKEEMGLGIKPGKGFTDIELTAEIGLLWERVLSKVMAEKYAYRPPQMCVDGVWMSPDGVGPDPDGEVPLVVEEYKAAWASTKRCPSENFHYMTQVKSYCRALQTPIAIFRIFHVMGDYRGSGPIYRVSRCRFTQHELDANWDMILKGKERL